MAAKKIKLLLEDGKEFTGQSFGCDLSELPGEQVFGEIVFNTGMSGYQEVLTDPSYAEQIITMTYPEIGNYGCNNEDYESQNIKNVFAKAMVIKNYSPVASNYRSEETLADFLKRHKIVGLSDIDTRALTKHIRSKGAMRSVIFPYEVDSKEKMSELLASEKMDGLDLASRVTCKNSYKADFSELKSEKKFKIIALDFGIKTNILRRLVSYGCDVEVVPAATSLDYILEQKPDGVFLSNGPGDPAAVSSAIEMVKNLSSYVRNTGDQPSNDKPIKALFGICLGHQILSLAMGAKTYKLKFGHRGVNQPIKNLKTSKIEISSHNHGFAVSKENLPDDLELTHLNINDDTVAGIKLKGKPVFSVQYHPEASPGPHDSDYLFKEFTAAMA